MTLYDEQGTCRKCGKDALTNHPGDCRDCDPYAEQPGICRKRQRESYLDQNQLCNPCSHNLPPPSRKQPAATKGVNSP